MILTGAERARELHDRPAYFLGGGEATWHRSISQMPDLTTTAAADSGRRAFEMAGLTPADVDVVELYDAFTINPVLFLEDLGFCAKGEGGAFVSDGASRPAASSPSTPTAAASRTATPACTASSLIIEAVRQLRGDCGERQVEPARVALAHGNGGVLSSQTTALLGTAEALA